MVPLHATAESHGFQREAVPLLHQREEPLLHQREMAGGCHDSNGHEHNDWKMYMKILAGIAFTTGNPKEYVLKVYKNIYSHCQVDHVWLKYLWEKLVNVDGFTLQK